MKIKENGIKKVDISNKDIIKNLISFLTEQTIEWIYEYNLLSKEEKEKAMKDIPIQLKIEDFVLKE